eukprot:SAG31_NODE_1015_length_10366_cov_47.726113_4_plen_172_part_00
MNTACSTLILSVNTQPTVQAFAASSPFHHFKPFNKSRRIWAARTCRASGPLSAYFPIKKKEVLAEQEPTFVRFALSPSGGSAAGAGEGGASGAGFASTCRWKQDRTPRSVDSPTQNERVTVLNYLCLIGRKLLLPRCCIFLENFLSLGTCANPINMRPHRRRMSKIYSLLP